MPCVFDSASGDDIVSVSIAYPDDKRPWEEMWRVVEQAFDSVKRRYMYTEDPVPVVSLKNDVSIFFLACHHLRDHLMRDQRVSQASKSLIQAELNHSDVLELAVDISNSFKRHTRKKSSMRLVRVYKFTSHPPSMLLGWKDGNGAIRERDALDLAQAAMADWRKILRSAGLMN